jgi:hypothetical protein
MAIGWLTVLKSVPWADVIVNAPKVADGAKQLWNKVGKKAPAPQAADSAAAGTPASTPDAASLAQVQARLVALEAAASELHQQMLASTEVIKSLAEQNAQLIRGIEANRVRLRWLGVAVAVLALAGVGACAWLLLR